MRMWVAALAAVVAMAGAALAQDGADLQRELDQVREQLSSVQSRLDEVEQADRAAGMRRDLEELAGKFGIFDVGVSVVAIAQHGMDVQKSTGARSYATNESVIRNELLGEPVDVVDDRSRLDMSLSVDIELAANLMPGGDVYMRIESDQGNAVRRQTGTLAGVNRNAQEKTSALWLSELWYQHSFEADMLVLTAGKIDFTRMFDSNAAAGDEKTQFISDALVDNMTIDYPSGRSWMGVEESPGVSPGLVGRLEMEGVDPLHSGYVMMGVADASQEFSDMAQEVFAILEGGVHVELFQGLPGNYRGYVWANTRDQINLRRDGREDRDGFGWGLSLDQKIEENTTLFFRWGMRDRASYMVNRAYSFGALYDGALWGRGEDAVGIGLNTAMLSGHAKRAIRATGRDTGDELLGEVFYRCQLNEYVAVSPVVQYSKNPGAKNHRKDLWVFGLRAAMEF